MVLQLHGPRFTAGGTAVVAMTLLEKQIPFNLVFVDMFAGEHKGAHHKEKQPFGQVPFIDDEGFMLYESRAICRYISEKHAAVGPELIPTDLRGRALFEQAASVEFANFEPHARKVYLQVSVQPLLGLPVNQDIVANAISELTKTLNIYEEILGKQRFLAGDEFTLVDIFHIAFGAPLADAGYDIMTTTGPNVARWWNEVISRPSWLALKDGLKSMPVVNDCD
ncbi:glutathione S-transferase [Mycena crocata]|nr:glutathione S-transferase [Mycena crocata]